MNIAIPFFGMYGQKMDIQKALELVKEHNMHVFDISPRDH